MGVRQLVPSFKWYGWFLSLSGCAVLKKVGKRGSAGPVYHMAALLLIVGKVFLLDSNLLLT